MKKIINRIKKPLPKIKNNKENLKVDYKLLISHFIILLLAITSFNYSYKIANDLNNELYYREYIQNNNENPELNFKNEKPEKYQISKIFIIVLILHLFVILNNLYYIIRKAYYIKNKMENKDQ